MFQKSWDKGNDRLVNRLIRNRSVSLMGMKRASTKGTVVHKQGWGKVHYFVSQESNMWRWVGWLRVRECSLFCFIMYCLYCTVLGSIVCMYVLVFSKCCILCFIILYVSPGSTRRLDVASQGAIL